MTTVLRRMQAEPLLGHWEDLDWRIGTQLMWLRLFAHLMRPDENTPADLRKLVPEPLGAQSAPWR